MYEVPKTTKVDVLLHLRTPLNGGHHTTPHDITDNSERPDRFSIALETLNSGHPATPYNGQ